MTECRNPMTGRCEQGHGCPVREAVYLPISFVGSEPGDDLVVTEAEPVITFDAAGLRVTEWRFPGA